MPDSEAPVVSRGFTTVDAKRAFVLVVILALVSVSYWFALPIVQSLILPSAPGGSSGPWVVRPILAFRFAAVVTMAAVTFPLITGPLRRVWAREDAALGTQYVPFRNRPFKRAGLYVKGILFGVIYAAGLLFYLLSWDVIGPNGIEEHLPWSALHHSYQDISSLETIPDSQWSESAKKDGPWYSVHCKDGRSIDLSDDNEGITRDELTAMTTFIAERAGLDWTRRSDARARRGK